MAVKILLVDDHAMFRAGIRSFLQLNPDFTIVGEAENAQDAMLKIKEIRPDIVVMDIAMPGMDGLSTTRLIKETSPDIKVILLTQHENKEYILPALKMGADGYILKRTAADELITAIKQVHAGNSYWDSIVTDVVVQNYREKKTGTDEDAYDLLTDREREVLLYLTKGSTYREIAETLCISIKTVEFHRTNIMRKLGISSRVELTKYAMRKGLI